MDNLIPIPAGLSDYRTTVANASEWVDKVLWDTQTYAQAGQVSLTFFQGLPANLAAGNLNQAGTIGNNVMIVRSVGVFFRSNVGQDIQIASQNGVLKFNIGAKNYGIWPVDMLPAGGGAYGISTDNTGLLPYSVSVHGMADPRAIHVLAKPLLIPPNLNFSVTMEWGAAIAIATATPVTVLLKGEMGRFVQ